MALTVYAERSIARRGLGFSADPTTYDLGTHRPADQLAQALEGYSVGPVTPPASSGMPAHAFPLTLVRRTRGLYAVDALTPPPGGSADVPVPPSGLPGHYLDDHNYVDARGVLWHVYPPTDPGSLTTKWGATCSTNAYDKGVVPTWSAGVPVVNPTREGLAAQIDAIVAPFNASGSSAGSGLTQERNRGILIGMATATVIFGLGVGVYALVKHARKKPRSNPRRNPRRRRRARRR